MISAYRTSQSSEDLSLPWKNVKEADENLRECALGP